MTRHRLSLPLYLIALGVFAAILLFPQVALAAPTTLVSHDADEIRAAFEADGDVEITLDDNVYQEFDGLYNREYWCALGKGSKTLDLAGHSFEIDAWWADGNQRWLFAVTAAETTFTINDSSAERSGEVIFNGVMTYLTRGWAGSHASDYYPVHVQHRNIVFVQNGVFILNGGKLAAGSKKSVYLGFGINAKDLQEYLDHGHTAALRYDGYVTEAINSIGITIESGSVLINGGTVEGRGYRELITGGPENHYYNTYTQGAAIWGTGGVLAINDGTIVGHTGAHALDLSDSMFVEIRAGEFITNKSGRVAVPHPSNEMFGGESNPYDSMFGGGEYGGHAPLFISPAEGNTGLRPEYLDSDMVDLVDGGETIPESNWVSQLNIKVHDDYSIVPTKNGAVTLIDSRTSTEIEGREIKWNGTESCSIQVPVSQYFYGYPWMNSYWVAVAQSTKSNPEGTSPTVYMGDQRVSTPDAATVEKEVGYNSSYSEVAPIISSGSGTLSFNLADLKPDGIGEGDSFIVDFTICQNLQPNGTGGYTQYLNCTRAIVVKIEPTLPTITSQPESIYMEDTSTLKTTLTATAEGATAAVWVQEWPTYAVLDRGIFDETTGTSTLDVDITNSAIYYSCHFYNKYGSVSSDTASVRYALNADIVGTDTEVTFYTDSLGGDLIVTGDLLSAWMSVGPSDREVSWYRLNGTERIPINYESGNHIIASTPHYHFGTPTAADNGKYIASIKIYADNQWLTYDTGTYTVNVVDGTAPGAIKRIDLYGIGEPHLGDIAPNIDDVHTGDCSYSVSSLRWNAYASDADVVLSVPESYYEVEFEAAEGYHFEYSDYGASFDGIPVYVDGTQVGWADFYSPGSGADPSKIARFSYAYYPVTLTPSAGLDAIVVELEQGADIDTTLSSATHYTDYGLIDMDESVVASTFSASSLPEWATLGTDGTLSGSVPTDAMTSMYQCPVTYQTNYTGSSTVSSGIILMVTPKLAYMELPADATLRSHVHEWGEWVDAEDGTHTRKCKTCGGQETQEHMWDEGEETDGVIAHSCLLCDAAYDEPAGELGHGPLELVAETPATCTADGEKSHYRCIECGRLFWDADGYDSVMAPEDLVIPATGHDWGEWETATQPTANVAGEQQRVCKNDSSHVEKRTVFLISFNLDGGTLDGKTGTVELVVPKGETITLPKPTRFGYTFSYWEGSHYDAGETYTVTESHAFTAVWEKSVFPVTGDDLVGLVVPLIALIVVSGACLAFAGVGIRRRRDHASSGKHSRK